MAILSKLRVAFGHAPYRVIKLRECDQSANLQLQQLASSPHLIVERSYLYSMLLPKHFVSRTHSLGNTLFVISNNVVQIGLERIICASPSRSFGLDPDEMEAI